MSITLESLQIIDAIARRGSFAAAAAELGRVPSALSYQVRRLEDELDVLIFDRREKRAQLTAAGRELLQRGRQLLGSADDLVSRVRQIATGWEQELRIAIDAAIPFDRIVPLVSDFDSLGAPTRLRLSHEVMQGCWDALLEQRADLAIGAPHDAPADAFGPDRFGMRILGELPFVFCVAPGHPLASLEEPIPNEALVGHRAVAIADTSRSLPARTTGLLSGQSLITVATFEQKIAVQAAGLGCGYLPSALAAPHIAAGALVARQLADPRPPALARYVWRKAGSGRALAWWLARLDVERVRKRLLASGLAGKAALSTKRSASVRAPARRGQRSGTRATRA